MYILRAEAEFDSAHFLHGYEGKCRNIHGHRWRIVAEISSEELISEGQRRGMVVDFGELKHDLREIADSFDHKLIYERGTLLPGTEQALRNEGFAMLTVDFRPTAENLSEHIYGLMSAKGYRMVRVAVWETPDNCAVYEAGEGR